MKPIRELAKVHTPPLTKAANCPTHGDYEAKCFLGEIWTKCPTCTAEARAAEDAAEKAKAEAAALELWRKTVDSAGIPERFRDRRFKNFTASTPEQQEVLELTKRYATDWETVRDTGRCMVMVGAPGTGKTHLACAIGTHVMHKHRASVLFRTVQQAVRSVRDTWVKGGNKSESQAIAELVAPQLLVMDEVGVQSGSEWEKSVLFDLLNERYQKRRPTILLTNLLDDDLPKYLGERVVDRLREDGGEIVAFTWTSQRGTQRATTDAAAR